MANLNYYQIAAEASSKIGNHSGLLYLKEISKHRNTILDVGCGEGTRLNTLLPKNKNGTGIDISKQAVKKAQIQYPYHNFFSANNENLPFKDGSFDLVYTTFVLEHTKNPKRFINEMLRVLSPKGELVIICPNYGAPNRRSPNSIENPIKKLIQGFINDFSKNNDLSWTKVTPKNIYHQVDDDTTVEPYLLSLSRFLRANHLKIIKSSSLWQLESTTTNPRKLLFYYLGRLGVFPFKYYGPQIFIAALKT